MEASEEGGKIAAILGLKTNRDLTSVILRFAAPLDKDVEETELANLADLAGKTEASLKVSHAVPVDAFLPPAELTPVCLTINRMLGQSLQPLPAASVEALKEAEALRARMVNPDEAAKPLFDRARAKYQQAWSDYLDGYMPREGRLPPPIWETLDHQAVSALCTEWNTGKAVDLLLDGAPQRDEDGTERDVEAIERVAAPCTLEEVLDRRTKRAALQVSPAKAAEAMAKEERAVYGAYLASIGRQVAQSASVEAPFLRKSPETVGDAECSSFSLAGPRRPVQHRLDA